MNIAVLLAGGSGTRMKADVPKQHLHVKGHQIVEYTLLAFSMCEQIEAVLIVSHADWVEEYRSLKKRFPKLKWVIEGGSSRAMSVYNAVSFLSGQCAPTDKIIISDAVRPCVTNRELEELVASLESNDAATTGIELYETILKTADGSISEILYRDAMFRQTSPEAYRLQALEELYLQQPLAVVAKYQNIGIDQLHASRKKIGLVRSTPLNFKITTEEDLSLFETVVKKGFESFLISEHF